MAPHFVFSLDYTLQCRLHFNLIRIFNLIKSLVVALIMFLSYSACSIFPSLILRTLKQHVSFDYVSINIHRNVCGALRVRVRKYKVIRTNRETARRLFIHIECDN